MWSCNWTLSPPAPLPLTRNSVTATVHLYTGAVGQKVLGLGTGRHFRAACPAVTTELLGRRRRVFFDGCRLIGEVLCVLSPGPLRRMRHITRIALPGQDSKHGENQELLQGLLPISQLEPSDWAFILAAAFHPTEVPISKAAFIFPKSRGATSRYQCHR